MRRMPFNHWLVVLSGALLFAAETSARAEGPSPVVVAVSGFASNPAAASQAGAVEALVGNQLAASKDFKVITQSDIATLLGIERQKQLLGATDGECTDSCMTELAGAVGARFVVSGRVDRFGEAYVLTANLFDAQAAKALVKARADAKNDAAIPEAVTEITHQLTEALSATVPSSSAGSVAAGKSGEGPKASAHPFSLGLLVGNSLIASIQTLNFSGDLEFGWRFERDWMAFVQVGTTLVRQDHEILPESFALVPSALGVRHLYLVDRDFQPYWGLGLGVQLAIGDFGFFGNTGPLPSVYGYVGFQYLITEHFSAGLEGSTNLAQTMLGLTNDNRGTGFNLDLSGALTWRF